VPSESGIGSTPGYSGSPTQPALPAAAGPAGHDGIDDSTFTAVNGNIGPVSATTDGTSAGDIGINNALFKAGTSITSITAVTGDTSLADGSNGAIVNSGFDAGQNIGDGTTTDLAISATGHISGSVFLAGIYLPSFNAGNAGSAYSGGAGNNSSLFGFNSVSPIPGVAPATIGAITLTGSLASIANSTFFSGVKGAGTDGVFGFNPTTQTSDDVQLSVASQQASGIGNISLPGSITSSQFEAGYIGTTAVGSSGSPGGNVLSSAFIGLATPAELPASTAGIGNITVYYNVPTGVSGNEAIALGGGPTPIETDIYSNANIGNIAATISGNAGNAFATIALGGVDEVGLRILAGTSIGSIQGSDATSSGTQSHAVGIQDVVVKAGLTAAATGGVGAISGTVTSTSAVSTNAYGIYDMSVDAAAGTGSIGGIGTITGTVASTIANGIGIYNDGFLGANSTVFRAAGNIAEIIASGSSDSIAGASTSDTVVFSATGNIGDGTITDPGVSATGTVTDTAFLAGFDIGSSFNTSNYNTDTVTDGGKIGTVTITGGQLLDSDIIASVAAAHATFGNGDSITPGGGSIGAINIGAAEAYTTGSPGSESYAIEAATIDTGTLTINSVSKSIPGTLDSNTAVQT